LQRILDDYSASSESVQGEGIGAELIRIIRQIYQARKNITTLEGELDRLSSGELSQLRRDTEAAHKEGVDLLAQLATKLKGKIAQRRKEHEALIEEVRGHGR
jgi:isocitrate/isopropylmalate dehydrogenase